MTEKEYEDIQKMVITELKKPVMYECIGKEKEFEQNVVDNIDLICDCLSLPLRAGKAFQATRKMGRTHQYCLCFVKGDHKKATERLGDVEIPDMSNYMEEE